MSIFLRFTNFRDFYGFRKPAATAVFGISKIPTVNFEIHSFSCYRLKNFYLLVTQICAMGSWIKGKKPKDFSAMLQQILFGNDFTSCHVYIANYPSRWFQVMEIPRWGGHCLTDIYSNIVLLNTKLFSSYLKRHPSKHIRTKKLPEKLSRCLQEP